MKQKVAFEEYRLANGLKVVLHQDNSVPIITTAVMYHVGAKDDPENRKGFAHFFEHLLFEGTKNIPRGDWFKIVSRNGGTNNANTSQDRTYYYEVFPSNCLQLGLWMESERMLHAEIDTLGVETQREVVKEEKRQVMDNAPYGKWHREVFKNLFPNHPYASTTIGEMEDINAASLEEFQAFYKKYYIPNNAVLVVAGDFKTEEAKHWIAYYFESIPQGKAIQRPNTKEIQNKEEKTIYFEDPNISLPALFNVYRTPKMEDRDSMVLNFVSALLSEGLSSRLHHKLIEDKKMAIQVSAFNYALKEHGAYIILAIPHPSFSLEDIKKEIDASIDLLCAKGITDTELERLQNQFEAKFIKNSSTIEGISHSLASFALLYENTALINDQVAIYQSITKEEIQKVAQRYLSSTNRLLLEYLPKQNTNATNK